MPLTIHFNEYSKHTVAYNPAADAWAVACTELYECLFEVHKIHSNLRLAFHSGCWTCLVGGIPFCALLKRSLKPDQYKWLQLRANIDYPIIDQMVDVYFNNQDTVGIKESYLTDSWVFSIPFNYPDWLQANLPVQVDELTASGISSTSQVVKQLSVKQLFTHWESLLLGWQKQIVNNNQISLFHGYVIIMYPKDHLPPHIHLVDSINYKTIAKYRFDKFELLKGTNRWTSEIEAWVSANKNELFASWTRCIRGQHPYRIP